MLGRVTARIALLIFATVLSLGLASPASAALKVYWTKNSVTADTAPPGNWNSEALPGSLPADSLDLWLAVKNDEDPLRRKFLHILIKGPALANYTPLSAEGFKTTDTSQPVSARAVPTGTLVEGNDQFHDSNWSLEPQPLWERIKLFWHSGTGQPSGPLTWTADSINSVCTDSRWVDPFLSLNNTSFDAPGATIGTPEWREVLIFPRYGVVNAFPPAFTAPPSTGVWSSTFVYVDPDGRARPNGGVKFTTSGSGLTVNDRFNAQIRIDGGVSYLYDVYSFNASTGKYERHAVRAGILSTPGVTLLSLALLAIATMAAGAFFLRRRGVA